jgi:hypothetical protein
VPAFNVTYKVQMPTGIDEGGTVKSDLFYGNFKNEVIDIGSSYSVYDQFKNGKNIALAPDRPVVRLPLKSGQYESYFAKYDDFALKTRYGRLPLVNFSNPIFASSHHTDDMSLFLRNRFIRAQIPCYIINPGTPKEIIDDIKKRIRTSF